MNFPGVVKSLVLTLQLSTAVASAAREPATVTIDWSHPLNTFDPRNALGAGIDGHEKGEVARMLSPANIAAMRSAGLRPLTYRLRTELAGEVWHWNPQGTWSDPAHRRGYWISDATPSAPINVSYGYKLPRRGNTVDQANNDGYSRIDDGDGKTFWKSNPYLDPLPQWIVIDLGHSEPIDTLRVEWGTPWATSYTVQYSTRDDVDPNYLGIWRDFPNATQAASGGTVTTRIAPQPLNVRRVRIVMAAGSHTAAAGGADPRDSLGFAIREVWLGTSDASGQFRDAVRHGTSRDSQSIIWVSSTDPWHTDADRDDLVEQPGFDRIFRDGLTNGLPMLTPVGILYDTPENAVAEVRYLAARHYAVEEVELGEEPEEQNVPPEYYGALYIQWAKALRAAAPKLRIGGNSMVLLPPEAQDNPSWIKRWIRYLRDQDALPLLQFFSFEWYPFDEVCAPVAPQLASAKQLLTRSLERLVSDGVPRSVPWFLTEYGYSAYGSQAEVELPGALLNAGAVATFFEFGGAKTFLYGYEPGELINEQPCSWGNNMILLSGPRLRRMPTYYGAQLLTQRWVQAAGGEHAMFAAHVNDPSLSVYALRRPDETLSLLLLNNDKQRDITVRLPLAQQAEIHQYSPAQYRWLAAGEDGRPVRNRRPVQFRSDGTPLTLPAYSLTVATGKPIR